MAEGVEGEQKELVLETVRAICGRQLNGNGEIEKEFHLVLFILGLGYQVGDANGVDVVAKS